ncbi:sodium-dependent noradrenaline transporter-like [Tenebrio molitor]|uniref:sodium-dependent noradrenaline transporter-like n=1 Tax=Tenebrio molitor TaxID=7067 RepID=UPI00362486F8
MKPEHSLSRRPSPLSQMDSHLTILRPRDSTPSEIMSTVGAFLAMRDRETWYQRARFIFRIICYCLGPGNIWRFPQQSFTYGNATYMYLYIAYSWIFGISLLVFEISLSQYFVKGFAKIFTVCPFMEGIALSMAIYCLMANLLYSMVGVYSFMYLFSGLYMIMPHSQCSQILQTFGCEDNYTNETNSPEYIYFYNYVVKGMDIQEDKYNFRNCGLLVAMWTLLCCIILFGLLKYHWLSMCLSIGIFIVLFITTITSLTLNGASSGLTKMFIPTTNDMNQLTTWVYPAEQSVVSLGVGAGPLTTVWSVSRIKYWSHVDCIMINAIVFFCSFLSGIIFFNAAGVIATRSNDTISTYAKNCLGETNIHIFHSHLFNTLDRGPSNFMVCLYFLILFGSCCFSMLEHIQIILLYINSYLTIKKVMRTRIIIGVCTLLYLSTAIGASEVGYSFIKAIDKNFIATALLIILCFEMISVSYFYGMRNFCDDIEFMIGFAPNYYYQTTWFVLPVVFFIISVASLYLKFKKIESVVDVVVLCLTLIFSIVPVVGFATYKCYIAIRNKGLRRMLNPRISPESTAHQLSNVTR